MMHFVESKAKPYALILHDLHFLFGFSGKIWVPSCTCIFKIWLKKCKTKHPTKLWCWKYAFAIEELIFFHYFFICHLVAPWPNLGHCWGGSLTNLMLITTFIYFNPKHTKCLITRLGPKAWPSPSDVSTGSLSNYECHRFTTHWIF